MTNDKITADSQSKELFNENSQLEEEEIIYSALGSQVRREIISFIQGNEKVGFLELRKKFDLKVGSLYHQLNSMKDLWHQDENKKYFLTDLGKVAYNLMIRNRDYIVVSNVKASRSVEARKSQTFFGKIYQGLIFFFLPRKIIQYLVSEPLRTLFEGLIIIGAMLFFSIDSSYVLVGFYPLQVDDWYYCLIGVFSLWLFLGLVSETFKTILYKREFNPTKLLAVTPFTLIPSLLVLFLLWLQTKVVATFMFLDGQILALVTQIWSLSLMTTAVSQTEELTMNKSSLIVLFTFYLTYVISFVLYGIS